MFRVADCKDADLHIQILVAVDDVVAAIALDGVASVAAEDDVATIKAGDAHAQDGLQALDQGDALSVEHTAEIARGAALCERCPVCGHVIGALEHIVKARAGETFDRLELVECSIFRQHRCFVEDDRDREIGIHAQRVVLVCRPVKAGHTHHLAATRAAHENIVAAFADELVEAAVTEEHVVPVDAVMGEDFVEVVAGGAVERTGFYPVIALVAEDTFGVLVAVDEVVAFTGEHLRTFVGAEEDEVLAGTAEHEVEARSGMHHVIARTGLDVVVAACVLDDVVAVATIDDVVAEPALELVVAGVAEEGIVADTGRNDVIAGGTAHHHVIVARIAKIVAVRAGSSRIVTHDERGQDTTADRVATLEGTVAVQIVELTGRVDFEDEAGRREHVRGQVRRVGIAHDHGGEGVVFHLAEQVQTVEALQIVEAITTLQPLHLRFEDEVERRSEHAAERHDLLGQAADPEIDILESAQAVSIGALRVEEVEGVCLDRQSAKRLIEDQCHGSIALALKRGLRGDQLMRSVGRNEVDDRGLVLEVTGIVYPALIGLEPHILRGRLVEGAARFIEGRHARITTASEVDRGEVQRQAEQVVPQRTGHELVDLVAHLTGHAADDGTGRDIIINRSARSGERGRVEEALDEADVVGGKISAEPVDGLGQHRVAEAIDHMRKLGNDRRIHGGVEAIGHEERIDGRLDLAGELLEHEVLILHLGAELGCLEQALAVPDQSRGGCRQARDIDGQPFVEERDCLCLRSAAIEDGLGVGEGDFLCMIDQTVVFGVEHVVHGRQADVLVGATVAGNEVSVEQLVVVFAVDWDVAADFRIAVR